jgi:hypothetical protein
MPLSSHLLPARNFRWNEIPDEIEGAMNISAVVWVWLVFQLDERLYVVHSIAVIIPLLIRSHIRRNPSGGSLSALPVS